MDDSVELPNQRRATPGVGSAPCPPRSRSAPVYTMQLATGYMNVALPSNLARMADNIRFFQRQGLSPVAVTSGTIDSFGSTVVQAVLLGVLQHRRRRVRARFAGRELRLGDQVYESASETNLRNRSLAGLLEARGRIYWDPVEAVDLYTKQSSLSVNARDLAVMGATLADGGVNPLSGERVIDAEACRFTLAVMATAGMYETSGEWLYDVGLPGKSGIGGGIVTIAPGKGGLGTFAPLLDPVGNSVKGRLTAGFMAQSAGLDLFASEPEQ